ncbi:response regulator transcription factor [Streptomyces scabiei]|nr:MULTISPECIES: response regulator transcription factor [Streptomyces]MBP5865986.1 response regulator transcription factor [Streptomyces sp. LBUM 1484]MBP5873264.1 response regulator transcription factor [Streptomyces sp. LBUM 1477]MBP5880948.1 response regulator transcription factor [Streptomyces sp. LBUM 1487]MBP5896168.1 response regulator transcription factor [Streptomyces sp. LBUM 1481]MBP5896702.1 response regulator transcription factor [Streptomyces sp. LBUM 1488]
MRVLLIEDDERIAGPLAEGLARYGYTVERARTGSAALVAAEPEMVLLDLGLPDMDGIDVCRALRLRSDVPIIMITARGEEVDRVLGLELGADDYMAKPFGVRELVARIRAVTRRARPRTATGADGTGGAAEAGRPGEPPGGTDSRPADAPQAVGPLVIDRRTRQVHLQEAPIALAPKEFDLLAHLALDPGAVCSRQQIVDQVWDPHFFGPTKTLDVHVAALRRKLGDPAWIETVRRVGFRLHVPDASTPPGSACREVLT